MTWTGTQGSAIFYPTFINPFLATATAATKPTSFVSITGDTLKCALFGNTGTPNKVDTLAHCAYNGSGSQWVTANEASGTNYSAGGATLASLATGTDATNTNETYLTSTNPSWTTVTLTNVYGDLIYDTTISGGTGVVNQGYCFNYFGGAQSITAGTFTVQWPIPGGGTTACFLDFTV